MTNSNPENPPVSLPPPSPPPIDNRRRLRELLSVPERDRTDDQWDEIIELEIQLAPGNRISASDHGGSVAGGLPHQNKSVGAGGGPGGQPKKHRPRTNNNRRPRQNKPPSGGNPA
jgi:hypothetical protein